MLEPRFTEDTKKLTKISIPDADEIPMPIRGLVWDGIPPGFVLITGQNGAGKTVLLNEIRKAVHRHSSSEHIASYFNPTHTMQPTQQPREKISDLIRPLRDILNKEAAILVKILKEETLTEAMNTLQTNWRQGFDPALIAHLHGDVNKFYLNKKLNIHSLEKTRIVRDAMAIAIKYPLDVDDAHLEGCSAEETFRNACRCLVSRYAATTQALARFSINTLRDHFPEFLDEEDYTKRERDYKTQADKIREKIQGKLLMDHPIQRINNDLKEVSFPYQFNYDQSAYNFYEDRGRLPLPEDKFYFSVRGDQSRQRADLKHLSSGQLMLLKAVSLKSKNYLILGGDSSHVMFLDEMDKHFDPKYLQLFMKTVRTLVSQGSQIFAITHRLDTISLARDGEIFTLQKGCDEGASKRAPLIEPSNKLLAISRLARNLNSFLGKRTTVYTEGNDDSQFYNPAYAVAKRLAHYYRETKERSVGQWHSSQHACSLLSIRYQMEFRSVSNTDHKGGGASAVRNIVDKTSKYKIGQTPPKISSFRNSTIFYNANLFKEYGVDGTFGLIDLDYPDNHCKATSRESKQSKADRIVILKRHSLENFLLDPVLMCSLFDSGGFVDEYFTSHHNRDLHRLKHSIKKLSFNLSNLRAGKNVTGVINKEISEYSKSVYSLCLSYRSISVADIADNLKAKLLELTLKNVQTNIKGNTSGNCLWNDILTKEIEAAINTLVDALSDLKLDNFCEAVRCARPKAKNKAFVLMGEEHESREAIKTKLYELFSQNHRSVSGAEFKLMKPKPSQLDGILNECRKIISRNAANNHLEQVYINMHRQHEAVLRGDTLENKPQIYHYFTNEGVAHVVKLNIPTCLKNIRGHDLEHVLLWANDEDNITQFKQWACNEIELMSHSPRSPNLFFPHDLLETYAELNSKIRAQMVSQAKPEKWKRYLADSTLAESKGIYLPHQSRQKHGAEAAPHQPSPAAAPERKSYSTLEQRNFNHAILKSQREIKYAASIAGQPQTHCAVIHAKADGDCGFHAIRHSFLLQNKPDIAKHCTREAYIRLIQSANDDTNLPENMRTLINNVWRADHASNFDEWKDKFRGRWIQEEDFKFLSAYFNTEFQFYSPQDGHFTPKQNQEAIYEGTDGIGHYRVLLAHVSTLPINQVTDFNHFDTLVLNPTPQQCQAINLFNFGLQPDLVQAERTSASSSSSSEEETEDSTSSFSV